MPPKSNRQFFLGTARNASTASASTEDGTMDHEEHGVDEAAVAAPTSSPSASTASTSSTESGSAPPKKVTKREANAKFGIALGARRGAPPTESEIASASASPATQSQATAEAAASAPIVTSSPALPSYTSFPPPPSVSSIQSAISSVSQTRSVVHSQYGDVAEAAAAARAAADSAPPTQTDPNPSSQDVPSVGSPPASLEATQAGSGVSESSERPASPSAATTSTESSLSSPNDHIADAAATAAAADTPSATGGANPAASAKRKRMQLIGGARLGGPAAPDAQNESPEVPTNPGGDSTSGPASTTNNSVEIASVSADGAAKDLLAPSFGAPRSRFDACFFPDATREVAEGSLRETGVGTFLLRPTSQPNAVAALSKHAPPPLGIAHFLVTYSADGFCVSDSLDAAMFSNLDDLIARSTELRGFSCSHRSVASVSTSPVDVAKPFSADQGSHPQPTTASDSAGHEAPVALQQVESTSQPSSHTEVPVPGAVPTAAPSSEPTTQTETGTSLTPTHVVPGARQAFRKPFQSSSIQTLDAQKAHSSDASPIVTSPSDAPRIVSVYSFDSRSLDAALNGELPPAPEVALVQSPPETVDPKEAAPMGSASGPTEHSSPVLTATAPAAVFEPTRVPVSEPAVAQPPPQASVSPFAAATDANAEFGAFTKAGDGTGSRIGLMNTRESCLRNKLRVLQRLLGSLKSQSQLFELGQKAPADAKDLPKTVKMLKKIAGAGAPLLFNAEAALSVLVEEFGLDSRDHALTILHGLQVEAYIESATASVPLEQFATPDRKCWLFAFDQPQNSSGIDDAPSDADWAKLPPRFDGKPHILVRIVEASNLITRDNGAACNPYVAVAWGGFERRTITMKKSFAPYFNEVTKLHLPDSALDDTDAFVRANVIQVTVQDKKMLAARRTLGSVIVSAAGLVKGRETIWKTQLRGEGVSSGNIFLCVTPINFGHSQARLAAEWRLLRGLNPRQDVSTDVILALRAGVDPTIAATEADVLEALADKRRLDSKDNSTADVSAHEPLALNSDPTFVSGKFSESIVLGDFKSAEPFCAAVFVKGVQPLHLYARREGGPSSLVALLEAKADPNCRDSFGRTPLHFAVAFCAPSASLALIANGADVSAQDNGGRTPLHYAVSYRVSSLGEHNRVLDILLASIQAAPGSKEFAKCGKVDLAAQDIDGNTALHLAAAMNNRVTSGLLLTHGAARHAKIKNARGKMALQEGLFDFLKPHTFTIS